jgi:tetratricopeptide (TPR) repeat protein
VKAANYYFNKGSREILQEGRMPAREGEMVIKDKSGKAVSSMGPIRVFNDLESVPRAANILREATQKFPDRIDIWFGLAFIHRELNDFDSVYSTLEETFNYAAKHPNGLKWKGDPLPAEEATNFIPAHTQKLIKHYFSVGTPDGDECGLRIAKLTAEAYPNHPFPLNSLGIHYARKKEWDQALSCLEKAHQLDPRDPLIMGNLAAVYVELHENAKARALFEKVVASDADEKLRQMARRSLEELK